jgi:predicted nucleotide-binding protein (sugar kinase/HSP70/actin superfamily)
MVLDEIGCEHVPMVVLDQTEQLSDHLENFGSEFYRLAWDLVVVVDAVQKAVRHIRPYEMTEGETDRVYKEALDSLTRVGEERGDVLAEAERVRDRLAAIAVDRSERRPLIGIVGEIYVRSHEFANNFLVRRLEQMGAEVALPTLQEWMSYVAHERREIAWQNNAVWGFVKEWVTEFVARWDEARIARVFRGMAGHMEREARTGEVLGLGARYLDPSVKGEAILSMGRAVEYVHHGFSGIVNVVPFGCMPGAIVNGLLEQFRADHENVPILKLAFDGVEQPGSDTLLDAFVHQCRQHMDSRSGREVAAERS